MFTINGVTFRVLKEIKEKGLCGYGLDSCGSEQGQVVGPCKHHS